MELPPLQAGPIAEKETHEYQALCVNPEVDVSFAEYICLTVCAAVLRSPRGTAALPICTLVLTAACMCMGQRQASDHATICTKVLGKRKHLTIAIHCVAG